MDRNRYLILLIGLALIGLFYFLFALNNGKEKQMNKPIKQTTEERLTSALVENARLSERVNCLEEMLAVCQSDKTANISDSNDLKENKNQKDVKDSKSNKPVIKIITEDKKRKSKKESAKVTKSPKKTVITTPKPEKKKEKVAPAKVYGPRTSGTGHYFPAHFYEPGTEGVKFCVRLGGNENRHLPHLAIVNGNMQIEANGISGYNWVIDGPVPDPIGDWGITEDKMFFVSVDMIEQFLKPDDNGIVELKAPATHWKPVRMEKYGDYYVCHVK